MPWLLILNAQYLSNMLRQNFIIVPIIIGLCAVICAAEPTNRHYPRSLIDDNSVTIDCAGSHADSPECRSVIIKNNDTSSTPSQKKEYEEKTDIKEVEKSWSLGDILNGSEVEEARGKKKKKGFGKMLMMMVAAGKATLMWVAIHAVSILAAKALIIAKIALALAAAIALKKSSEHQDKSTYEIIKHPQHSYSQTHSSSVDYDHHGGYEGHRRRKRFVQRS